MDVILRMPFKLVVFYTCIDDARPPLTVGIRTTASFRAAQGSSPTSDVLLMARIVPNGAVDLQDSSDKRLEEGGACCNDADIKLEAA